MVSLLGDTLPVPDSSTFQASGDPAAPTLSWGAIGTYQGNLFYRARIYDLAGNHVWTSGYGTETRVAVPEGELESGISYQWRVEAFDNYNYTASANRAARNR